MAHFESPLPEIIRLSFVQGEPDPALLKPQELAEAAEISSDEARKHFILGRIAAGMCLESLGAKDSPVLRASGGRAPIWPSGFVGSIAHSHRCAVSVVGVKDHLKALGVDIEAESRAGIKTASRILTPLERRRLESAREPEKFLTAVFSAKESLFKALNPLTGVFFGFQDAETDWNDSMSSGRVSLLKDLSEDFKKGLSLQCYGQSSVSMFVSIVADII